MGVHFWLSFTLRIKIEKEREAGNEYGQRLFAAISCWLVLGRGSVVKEPLFASLTGPLSLQAGLHPASSLRRSVCLPAP